MFQHVITLFSFIFAIALTHVFASTSALILAGDRVRFYGLQATWMFSACFGLLVNWMWLPGLESLKHWSVIEVILQLSWAVPQYFTCSLVSIEVPKDGPVNMRAIYEQRRPKLFSVFVVLYVTSMVVNFADRNNMTGWMPTDWIKANLLVLLTLIAALIAGWAKSLWLQWVAVCVTLALQGWFLASFDSLS
jgi:hypothetical protein